MFKLFIASLSVCFFCETSFALSEHSIQPKNSGKIGIATVYNYNGTIGAGDEYIRKPATQSPNKPAIRPNPGIHF